MNKKYLIKKIIREIFEDKAPQEKPKGKEGDIVPPTEQPPSTNGEILKEAKEYFKILKDFLIANDELNEDDIADFIESTIINPISSEFGNEVGGEIIATIISFPAYKQISQMIKNEIGYNMLEDYIEWV